MDFPANLAVASLNTTRLQGRVSDLEEYVNYNITVRAYTSVGPGPYSDPMIVRTSEDGNGHTLFILCVLEFKHSFFNPQYQLRLLRMSKLQPFPLLRSW